MKVEVKIRSDGERGLFAVRDIKKGEFICIMPIDYFQIDDKWYVTKEQTNRIDFRYGILCEVQKDKILNLGSGGKWYSWGNINNISGLLSDCETTEIIGVSNSEVVVGDFVGHMINDYVDMSFLTEKRYEKLSKDFSNVNVSSKLRLFGENDQRRFGLKIKASKDIKKGNELYLSYGVKYWKKYSGKEQFIHSIRLSIRQLS